MSAARYTGEFGGCPVCWRNDGYLNVHRTHVFYCTTHKKRWSVGSNLFSSWRSESEVDWTRNAEFLANFEECEAAYCGEGYANEIARRVPGIAEQAAAELAHITIVRAMSDASQSDEAPF